MFKLRDNGMFSETGKPLCIETCENLSNAFQTAFHIQCDALCDFRIITTWWTGNVKEHLDSYIIGVIINEITLLLEN